MVECQLPKLDVVGSNPIARYKTKPRQRLCPTTFCAFMLPEGKNDASWLLYVLIPLFRYIGTASDPLANLMAETQAHRSRYL